MITPFGGRSAHETRMAGLAADNASAKAGSVEEQLNDLRRRHEKLLLANQVMWEILKQATELTDADFEQRLAEADARDGMMDGRLTHTGVDCPACGRKTSSARPTCMYCGEKVVTPLFSRF